MDKERSTLLIVDDDALNRALLRNIFESQYEIEEAADGEEGLLSIQRNPERLCAVLLDVVMPKRSGLQVLEELASEGFPQRTPVFLITAEATGETVGAAYRLGVMDVIQKPLDLFVVRRRVQSVIELFEARKRLSGQVESQAEKIIRLNQGMIEALATAIEFRSEESGDHVRRIHDITWTLLSQTALGEGYSEEQVRQMAQASITHDVGKIAVPDNILNKPGRLTQEEFEVMKTHTVRGAQLLDSIPQLRELGSFFQYARDIARHHHERWDGRGYPDGLRGDEISPWAQAVSLADVYDALRCKRVYKDALPREQVLAMIRQGDCGAFSPKLLESFFSVEDQLSHLYEGKEG
ncbi:MAG: HD-GYP domain-containing protein [Acutalibacter sp.]|jgi:putative two-component system response regulator